MLWSGTGGGGDGVCACVRVSVIVCVFRCVVLWSGGGVCVRAQNTTYQVPLKSGHDGSCLPSADVMTSPPAG